MLTVLTLNPNRRRTPWRATRCARCVFDSSGRCVSCKQHRHPIGDGVLPSLPLVVQI